MASTTLKSLALSLACLLGSWGAHADNRYVQVQTNQGSFLLELYFDKAPTTVTNFLYYATEGFYDGTIFHRVIDRFVIQGGGYLPDYTLKETQDAIPSEANNGLLNEAGTIAMARARDPHSATAQFYINLERNLHLNHHRDHPDYYGNTVFGRVIEGMDVVKKIAATRTGAAGPFRADVPLEPVVIERVALVERTLPAPTPTLKGKSDGKTADQSRRNRPGT